MNRREALAAGIAAAVFPGALLATPRRLDVAWVNGTVWTDVPGAAPARSLGTVGNRIAAVGDEQVRSLAGPGTRTVDLEGGFVVPGFIDNHTHFLRASQMLSWADLRQAASRAKLVEQVGRAAAALGPGEWLQGGNWDEQRWGGELPSRHWIDPVTPDTPVAVVRLDQHMMLLNSVALRLAGIDRNTPTPPGGQILRDADGEPTGIVKDNAKELVLRVMPEPTDREIDAAIHKGIEHGLSLGVTQAHIKELDWVTHDALRRIRARGEPGMRFYSFVPLPDWERLDKLVAEEGRGDDWVRWGGLKGFVDGSLGSRTALFHCPYDDAPDEHGITVVDPVDLRRWVLDGDRHGLHVSVHAIGDLANRMIFDIFADAILTNGSRDRRFLIEHAQHLGPAEIALFQQYDVTASMQPYHAVDDGRWAVNRIGEKRLQGTYAFKSLLNAGARLSFGSDWPVAPLDPRTGIHAAVLRQTIDGTHPDGWLPEERISVEAALHAYTTANAYAGFQEDRLGTIAPGFLADFVVLPEDLRRIDPARIPQVPVVRTIVNGQQRFGDDAAPAR